MLGKCPKNVKFNPIYPNMYLNYPIESHKSKRVNVLAVHNIATLVTHGLWQYWVFFNSWFRPELV